MTSVLRDYGLFAIGWLALVGATVAFAFWIEEMNANELEGLEVGLRGPVPVQWQSDFVFTVLVTNTTPEPVTVTSVEVDVGLAEALRFGASEPAYRNSSLDESGTIQMYFYNDEIPPDHELPIQFSAHATRLRTEEGDVVVCFAERYSCAAVSANLPVVP